MSIAMCPVMSYRDWSTTCPRLEDKFSIGRKLSGRGTLEDLVSSRKVVIVSLAVATIAMFSTVAWWLNKVKSTLIGDQQNDQVKSPLLGNRQFSINFNVDGLDVLKKHQIRQSPIELDSDQVQSLNEQHSNELQDDLKTVVKRVERSFFDLQEDLETIKLQKDLKTVVKQEEQHPNELQEDLKTVVKREEKHFLLRLEKPQVQQLPLALDPPRQVQSLEEQHPNELQKDPETVDQQKEKRFFLRFEKSVRQLKRRHQTHEQVHLREKIKQEIEELKLINKKMLQKQKIATDLHIPNHVEITVELEEKNQERSKIDRRLQNLNKLFLRALKLERCRCVPPPEKLSKQLNEISALYIDRTLLNREIASLLKLQNQALGAGVQELTRDWEELFQSVNMRLEEVRAALEEMKWRDDPRSQSLAESFHREEWYLIEQKANLIERVIGRQGVLYQKYKESQGQREQEAEKKRATEEALVKQLTEEFKTFSADPAKFMNDLEQREKNVNTNIELTQKHRALKTLKEMQAALTAVELRLTEMEQAMFKEKFHLLERMQQAPLLKEFSYYFKRLCAWSWNLQSYLNYEKKDLEIRIKQIETL